MQSLIKLLRVKHYIKNFFIFLPLFFSGQLANNQQLVNVLLAFVAFCCVASAVYIFNDYRDIESDKLHRKKKFRPLASGAISTFQAKCIFISLIAVSGVISIFISREVIFLICSYLIMNFFYSLYLKKIAIIDVTIIAIGFAIRLFVGALAADVYLSQWIIIMTFLLSLFLAVAKRRDDAIIYQETGTKMRESLSGYNLQFLDSVLPMLSAIVIVAYINYVTSSQIIEKFNSQHLYLTSIFVILGILRYLHRIFVIHDAGSPTDALIKDHFLQATVAAWVISFIFIIYL